MSQTTTPDQAASPQTAVLTPTVRQQFRRGRFWIVIGLILIGSLLVSLLVNGMGGSGVPLDPASPGPTGGKALATVLTEQGVAVHPVDSLDALEQQLSGQPEATVLVLDLYGILEQSEQWQRLRAMPAHLVVLEPGYFALRDLGFDAQIAGSHDGLLDAACAAESTRQQLSVLADGSVYLARDQATACFTTDTGSSWMLQYEEDGRLRTVLGGWQAFSNERIIEAGNAALALRLLGGTPTVHWYQPSFADLIVDRPPSLAELSPEVLPSVMILLLLTAIAAGLWRGRRFGPLVPEPLPVEVPARETMEGRARLYRDAGDANHALDALRLGTLHRLGLRLGLDVRVPLTLLVDRLAEITGANRGELLALLRDAEAGDDRELVARSDALLALEELLARTLENGNSTPPTTAKDA